MACGARRAAPCSARLRLVGWTTPGGVAHVVCRGYLGSYPPQLVLERLASAVQRRLELIREGVNKAEQSDSWSNHPNESLSSCGP